MAAVKATWLTMCALALTACAHTPRPGPAAPAVIAAQLDRFLAGVSAGDASVHGWWWADDLVYTSSAGQRFGKSTILDGAAGARDPDAPVVRYTAEDVQVTVYGNLATLAFRLVAAGPGHAAEYLNSGTLRFDGDRWQVILWQATRVPEPS